MGPAQPVGDRADRAQSMRGGQDVDGCHDPGQGPQDLVTVGVVAVGGAQGPGDAGAGGGDGGSSGLLDDAGAGGVPGVGQTSGWPGV
jgi:hypothetical protein